ncbi:sigma-70 family RNA polymerase sigma factor [Planctomycetales bacterium ZRK34]|nr:sigma-70 family RNA polymerase sigma factor [Planctomycetales bacterium ZRK34]
MNHPNRSLPTAKEEFLTLFLAHQRALYAIILAMVPNASDADDLVQRVSLVLWQKFDTFEAGTSFLAWATQVARFEVLSFRREKATGHVFNDALVNLIADRAQRFSETEDHRLTFLRACMQELGERERQMLTMRYGEDLRPRQIAERRKESLDAIYKILARTHQALLHCIRRKAALAAEEHA